MGRFVAFALALVAVGLTAPSPSRAAGPPSVTLSMSVRSDAPSSEFTPGSPLTYLVRLENAGVDDVGPLTLEDQLPPEVRVDGIVTPIGAGDIAPDGRRVTITGIVVPAGGVVSIGLLATLADVAELGAAGHPFPTLEGLAIANQSTVVDPGDPMGTPRFSDEPSTPAVDDATRLALTALIDLTGTRKTVEDLNGGELSPGDTLEFTISLENRGNVGSPVLVDDSPPAGLLGCVGVRLPAGLTCDETGLHGVTDLPAGGTEDVTFTMTVDRGAANGLSIRNVATVQSTLDALATVGAAARALRVVAAPILVATKVATGTTAGHIAAGEAFVFEIRVRNTGNRDATGVVITDAFNVPATVQANALDGGRFVGGRFEWSLDNLAPGAATTVRLAVAVGAEAVLPLELRNQAFATANETARPVATDDPALAGNADATLVTVDATPARFVVTKSAVDENGGDLTPGDIVRYDLTVVSDTTTSLATVPTLEDSLPPSTNLVDAPGADLFPGGVRWELPLDWISGEPLILSLRVRLDAGLADGTRIANRGVLRGLPTGDVESDDPATPGVDPTLVVVVGQPAAGVALKSVTDVNGGTLLPGDTLRYDFEISNAGGSDAIAPQVVDDLPDGVTFVSGDLGPVLAGRRVIWRLPRLEPGATVAFGLEVTVDADAAAGLVLRNQATVSLGGGAAPVPTDDPATAAPRDATAIRVSAPPNEPLLVATKSLLAPADGAYGPGDEVTYGLTLENRGGAATDRLEIVDPLDQNLTGTFAENGQIDAAGRSAAWAVAPIPPGGRVQLTLRAVIGAAVPIGTRVSNQYGVRPSGAGAFARSDDPTTPVAGDPVVFVVGEAMPMQADARCELRWSRPDGRAPAPGESVTYRVACVNRGRVMLNTLVLVDLLPNTLGYVAGSTQVNGLGVPDLQGAAPFVTGLQLLNGMPLFPGNATLAAFDATVLPGVAPGTSVANQGRVTLDAGVVVATDDPDTAVSPDPTRFVVSQPVMALPDLTAFRKSFIVLGGANANRAEVGDVVEWTLTAENRGGAGARNLSIRDEVPARTRYVAGSLTVDGQAKSDAPDRDTGEVAGRSVAFRRAELAPGSRWQASFRTTVVQGPFVQNQASLLAEGLRAEASDDDADERNGNGPTVVPVGEAPVTSLSARKGLEVSADGREVTYSLAVRNTGTTALQGVTVADELPLGTELTLLPDVPRGARAQFEPGRRRLTVSGLSLASNAESTLVFRASVDPALPGGTRLCNVFSAQAPGVGATASEPVCFNVEARLGSVDGRIYQDADGLAGFGAEDLVLGEMRVRVVSEAGELHEARSDTQGRYWLEGVTAAAYEVEVITATGTTVARRGLKLEPGQQSFDLEVAPTGRLYQSRTGALLDGMRVYLYRDRDLANDDVFDAASRNRRTLVPGAELESPSQQGQTTTNGGLYRLAPKRAGRYFIEVVPPETLVWPSILRPSRAGVLPATAPPLSETALPELADDDGPAWTAAFETDGVAQLRQNHLPLDPLDALLEIQKRALKSEATVGEVVTYEIDVVNRSPRDLTYDAATTRGGLYVEDTLPAGFRYVAGSAVLVRVGATQERSQSANDPVGETRLRFGEVQREGARDVLRPISVAAGGHVRLRYQTVLGANVLPRQTYTNRARLLSSEGAPLSADATAKVMVTSDPDLDQGVLLGKVFCDADADGGQGPGEPGLPGALVLSDGGDFAVTDSAGKFHFQALEAGTRAFKLDTDSLYPGATLTTDETRIILLTRGLPAKIAFGVTCPAQTAADPKLELAPEGLMSALATLKQRALVVTGNVRTQRVHVDALDFKAAAPLVALVADGVTLEAPDLHPGGLGVTADLAFDVRVPADAPRQRWALWVGALGGTEQVVAEGEGPPPDLLPWDQRDLEGGRVLEKGHVYAYRVEVSDAEGRTWGSPAGVFGVGAHFETDPPLIAALRGALFSEADEPEALLDRELRKLLPRLRKYAGTIRVEVHGDDALAGPEMQIRTLKRAEATAVRLRGLLGQGPAVVGVGMGATRPLAPNLSERQRARNRRVELRSVAAEVADAGRGPPRRTVDLRATYAPVARIGRDEAPADAQGEFALTAAVPEDGVLEVSLRDVDGRRAVIPIRRHAGAPAAMGAPRVIALSGTPPGALTLGGGPLSLPTFILRLTGPARLDVDARGRPAPTPLGLEAPTDLAEWSVVVLSADGLEVFRSAGRGGAPREVVLGAAGPWAAGDYSARLTARRTDGTVGQSAPLILNVGGVAPRSRATAAVVDAVPNAAAIPARGWRVFLDGRPLASENGGRIFGETVVRDGGRVLVETVAPDGATSAFFVRPPGEHRPTNGSVLPAMPGPTLEHAADGPQASVAPPSRTIATTPAGAAPAPTSAYARVEPTTPLDAPFAVGDSPRVEAPAPPAVVAPGGNEYARVDDAIGPAPTSGSAVYRRIDELDVGAAPAGDAPGPVNALGLHAYLPTSPRSTLPAAPPARSPMSPAARAEVDQFGRAELLRALAPQMAAGGDVVDVPARHLSVQVPAEGAVLAGRTVPVRGLTHPENRIYVNGVEFPVGPEGEFGGAALFPSGSTVLEIAAVDVQGNRGVIRRNVVPAESQWFLLALADGAAGAQQNPLDGTSPETRIDVGETAWVHGRGVAWVRGRVQGRALLDGLFSEYEVEGHVDSARRRENEPAFRSLIDPERYYPTYGDSARLENPIHTRGPVYVLIRADESRLTVGDFDSEMKGLELFRYDRSLYGAQLKLDKESGTERQWHHEATAFAADLDAPERHAYVELRGTGGSLYYLPYEELIEGSERVYLIERDRETGIERSRRVLIRDADYSIRYREGRILVKTPVPRVSFGAGGPRPQAQNGRRGDVLSGHPIYLAVEMDHRDATTVGDSGLGAHVRETYAGALTLGGGYLEEGQSRDAASRYRLWGAEAGVHHGRRTHFETEWVQSRNGLGTSLYSDDGGLTYEPFHGRTGEGARGTGMLVRGGLELDDLTGAGDRDHWYTDGYWQYLAPGFYSGGTLQSQGLEKYGVSTRYTLDENHQLRLQHDAVVADAPETQGDIGFRGYRRATTLIGHTWTDGPLKLDSTFAHTRDDEGPAEPDFVTDVLNFAGEYALTPRWTLLGGQELVVRGDARLHDSTADLLATTAGARYQVNAEVSVEGTETVRWSGDNATQIGLRTEVDERHTVYVNERFVQQDGRAGATSVVGGEERWGEDQSGRSYGEYQLEAGELGTRNRAILGLGKRTKLVKGLTMDAGYERSQVLGGAENGEMSSDTVSLGSEWLDSKRVKVSGRYELRYVDNSEEVGRRDRLQFLTLNGVDWLLTPDFTFLVRLNYSHTYDLGFEATEAELVEGSLGLAFRPVTWDDFAALLKYTKRYEQRPTDLLVELPIRDEYDVISLVPMLELPWHFQVVEKVAFKRMATRTLNVPTVVSQTVLWINRLNYHVTSTWDAGVEYRVLTTTLAANRRHGALAEVNYIIQRKVRLGVGYNFTSFSDDEFARLDEDHGGPFFRVIANY